MNVRRIAALLREISALGAELADAIEQPDPAVKTKARKRPIAAPMNPPAVSPETMDRVRRSLRRKGLA